MGEKGLLTINPKHIIDWFIEAQNYGLQKVVADNFRMDLLDRCLKMQASNMK